MTQKPTWPIQSGQSGRDGVEYDLEEIDREEASPAFKHHQAWDLRFKRCGKLSSHPDAKISKDPFSP